ncbi:MAG: pilus assembly protein PilP [Desulfovibrionales bacterium]|nr:pilus assembly protein PilP [Desulfovibrionales bacterium]
MACSLMCLMLIFAGCKDKKTEPPLSVPNKGSQKTEAASPSSGVNDEIGMPEKYSYNPIGKPDPFKPFISEEKTGDKSKTVSAGGVALPLQGLDIGQLTLVAVIANSRDPYAMVEDASGRGYILRTGSRVGTQEGVVTGILADRVVVTETVKDFTGKIRKRPVILRLSGSGEGED